MSTLEIYRGGNVQNSQVEYLADGTASVTFTRRGDRAVYHLVVEHLYRDAERVLVDEVLPQGRPGG